MSVRCHVSIYASVLHRAAEDVIVCVLLAHASAGYVCNASLLCLQCCLVSRHNTIILAQISIAWRPEGISHVKP